MNPEDWSSSDDEMTTVPIYSSAVGAERAVPKPPSPLYGLDTKLFLDASGRVIPPPPPPVPLFGSFFEDEINKLLTMPAPAAVHFAPMPRVPAPLVPIEAPKAAPEPKPAPKISYAAISKTAPPKPEPKLSKPAREVKPAPTEVKPAPKPEPAEVTG